MQLVLSNNRIIAHGENFLSMGGVVINTETSAKYENATIAECNGCPSDIDSVGYEYHAGVFVPCAPYGKGNNNGYFMEVCADCATPRSSGIPIRDLKWDKIASINCVVEETAEPINKAYYLPVTEEVLKDYSMLRFKIKEGSFVQVGSYIESRYSNAGITEVFIRFNSSAILSHHIHQTNRIEEDTTIKNKKIVFENDCIVPLYLMQKGTCGINIGENTPTLNMTWYDSTGTSFDPLGALLVTLPTGWGGYNKCNIVFEMEGRK